MSLKIIHKFVSAKADGGDSTEVKPSDWNNTHDLATDGPGGTVVGRDTSGPGALQELPLAYDLTGAVGRWVANVVGSWRVPRGTTAQRPTGSLSGEMRWNTDLGVPEMYDGAAWQPVAIGTQSVQTGMVMGWYSNTAPAGGWLFLNGQTIGDASSGAAHPSVIYQALFAYIWQNIPGATVSGGRGADAPTDWAAHKTITLPDECGRTSYGANNMGGIATKDRLNITRNPVGIDGETMGASGGEERHTLSVAELAPHTHPGPSFTGVGGFGGAALIVQGYNDGLPGGSTGSGTPHNTVAPGIIRNSIIKV